MAKLKSQGTTIWYLNTTVSPYAYVQIGQVVGINGPDGSTGEIDVTDLDSNAKEFVASLPDWGSVSLDTIWDPKLTSHLFLWNAFSDQATDTYQIRLANSPQSKITFDAFPNAHPVSLAVDDKVGATIGLRVTGECTLT